MTQRNERKRFSCLDFKDAAQAEILGQTEGMSRARQAKYFESRVESGPFADLWKRIPKRSARPRQTPSRRAS